MYDEIKIYEPENLHKYKRMHDLNMEIGRLNCVLSKGYVSKQMFDEIVKKLVKLEYEYHSLISPLIMKNEKIYHKKYMELSNKKKEEIYKKFKLKKCDWCSCLYDEEFICLEEDCESWDFF